MELLYYFYSHDKEDVILNLVLEFIPETLYQVARRYSKAKDHIPFLHCKVRLGPSRHTARTASAAAPSIPPPPLLPHKQNAWGHYLAPSISPPVSPAL